MTPDQTSALQLTQGKKPTAKEIERVGAKVGADLARWAFTQWDLRDRARAKFARADEMLFDRDGLEMATHEAVAAYHASRFQEGAPVADIACGIGGDLIALARRGPAVGYETDPQRAEYARHNLAVHGLRAEVFCGKADLDKLDCSGAFLDPQRRAAAEYGEPDPRALVGRDFKTVAVKLGTGMDMDQVARDLFPRVEAVSFGGECRELVSWSGRGEGHFAVHIESGEELPSSPYPPIENEPEGFLFHADPAAIKARCLGALCERYGIKALGDSDGYLTGPQPVHTPWLRAYRVVHHGAADRKATQAKLKELAARITEVKTRGTREPADDIRATFKPRGDRPLTLAVWPIGKSLRHTLLEPITDKL